MIRFKFLYVTLVLFLSILVSCNSGDENGVANENRTTEENKATDKKETKNENKATYETKESFLKIQVKGEEGAEDASFTSDASVSASGAGDNFTVIISRGPNVSNLDFMLYLRHKFSNIDDARAPLPEGTYNLVPDKELGKDDSNFSFSLVNFVTETSFGYEVIDGTLKITESNESYVKGEFSCTTTSFTRGKKKVEVSGSFLANYSM